MKKTLVIADIINPLSDRKCEYIPNGWLVFDGKGKIEAYGSEKEQAKVKEGHYDFLDLSGHVIFPPFFDLHFHWVQDDVRSMPKESLLDWLKDYTWPAEAKFKSKNYAQKKAKSFFDSLRKQGTLGGAIYGSIHPHSVDAVFEHAKGHFVAGPVVMTMNSPKSLLQTKEAALKENKQLATKYKDKFAFTPRFAPTVHPDVMKAGARLAKQKKSFMQTHLAETTQEIHYVLSLFRQIPGFEKIKNYTEIYKKCGMLGPRTIMGHGIHLSSKELEYLKTSKTVVAHCPTSNAPLRQKGLGSGLFNFKKCESAGVDWGLASDIGGGPFVSMIDVMNSFVYQNEKAKHKGATYTKALYRATLKGAEVLKCSKEKGNFAIKKEASFLIMKKPRGSFKNTEELLKKLFSPWWKKRLQTSNALKAVYYQGKKI